MALEHMVIVYCVFMYNLYYFVEFLTYLTTMSWMQYKTEKTSLKGISCVWISLVLTFKLKLFSVQVSGMLVS